MTGGVVSADQVARAYTVPLEGVTQAIQYYDQLNDKNAARREAQANKKEAMDYRKASILHDAFDGLDIGTGTPWDAYGSKLVGDAHQSLIDYQKKNPAATPVDLQQAAWEAVKGIRPAIDNAKKAAAMTEEWSKHANAEYPHLDQTQLKRYALQKTFFDDNGQVLSAPNTGYNLAGDLQNPEIRAGLLNPQATQLGVSTFLGTGVKPEPYRTQGELPGSYYEGTKRFYQDSAGNPIVEPVSFGVPQQPAVNPLATSMPGAPQGLVAPPQSAPATYAGVPVPVLNRLIANPAFADALIAERRRMERDSPGLLKGASDLQKTQIAGAHLIRDYGTSAGNDTPELNTTIPDLIDKRRHEATMEGLSAAHLSLEQKKFQRLQGKDNATASLPDNPYTLMGAAMGEPTEISPAGQALIDRHTYKTTSAAHAFAGLPGTVMHTDWMGVAGKPYFDDPSGGDGRIRVSSEVDPNTLETKWIVQHLRKSTKEEVAKGKDLYTDEGGRVVTYTGKEAKAFRDAIASDLQVDSKKKNMAQRVADAGGSLDDEE